jgi:hypothetical protein
MSKKNNTKNLVTDVEVAKKLINIYQSAQDRKIDFNLSFEYVKNLLEYKTCYYTGAIFTEDGTNARSFDRIDSDKGYVEGNVVACTIDINGKKANLSFEEIDCLHAKLAKLSSNRKKKMPKILIIGNARHGKDTLAEFFNKHFGMTFKSSSHAANELFIFDKLKEEHGYKTLEQCFEDRVNHREKWYEMVRDYNNPDRARLAKEIISMVDCYVGMRDQEEFLASKDLFDVIIYVDAEGREKKEKNSFTITKFDADLIVTNKTTLSDFESKAIKLGKLIFNF